MTLCNWAQREAIAAPSETSGGVRFAEVTLRGSMAGGLEVRLPDGTTARGERIEELATLVRALRA